MIVAYLVRCRRALRKFKSLSAKAWLQAASCAVRGFAVSKHSASCKVDWSRLQNLRCECHRKPAITHLLFWLSLFCIRSSKIRKREPMSRVRKTVASSGN